MKSQNLSHSNSKLLLTKLTKKQLKWRRIQMESTWRLYVLWSTKTSISNSAVKLIQELILLKSKSFGFDQSKMASYQSSSFPKPIILMKVLEFSWNIITALLRRSQVVTQRLPTLTKSKCATNFSTTSKMVKRLKSQANTSPLTIQSICLKLLTNLKVCEKSLKMKKLQVIISRLRLDLAVNNIN